MVYGMRYTRFLGCGGKRRAGAKAKHKLDEFGLIIDRERMLKRNTDAVMSYAVTVPNTPAPLHLVNAGLSASNTARTSIPFQPKVPDEDEEMADASTSFTPLRPFIPNLAMKARAFARTAWHFATIFAAVFLLVLAIHLLSSSTNNPRTCPNSTVFSNCGSTTGMLKRLDFPLLFFFSFLLPVPHLPTVKMASGSRSAFFLYFPFLYTICILLWFLGRERRARQQHVREHRAQEYLVREHRAREHRAREHQVGEHLVRERRPALGDFREYLLTFCQSRA